MTRTDGANSATLLTFPRTRNRPSRPISRADIERGVARGRALQAEALQAGFRRFARFLVSGCSLRGLRVPGELPGQRHSCC